MNGIQRFLFISGLSLIMIGLLYGVSPKLVLGEIIGLLISENQLHIYRSIMGLYCGLGGFLIYGALKNEFTFPALVVETILLGGLAFGRLISLLVDGYVHWFSILAVSIELPLLLVCLLLIKRFKFYTD